MADIQLKNVYKRFPDGHVGVDNANLSIKDGEFIILVGPSGCGKSTTLNMIAGLEDISEGDLLIDGKRVNDVAPKDRDIAMVFQSYALYPHMTVRENIAFPLKLAKLAKSEIDTKVEEAAEILDLTDFLDRKPSNLSGGQRQRVAMGRAIVRRPKVFLMDEPLSNLDAKLRVQMRTEIAQLQDRLGVTTVYVTHDQTEAMTLGDRVVVMNKGIIQQVGSPHELYMSPVNLFVAGFIGSPAMNFINAKVIEGGRALETGLGTIPLSEELATKVADSGAKELIAGFRPEAFEDAELVRAGHSTFDAQTSVVTHATVEVLEALGSEKFVHFHAEGTDISRHQAAIDAGLSERESDMLVARVSAESPVGRGDQFSLAVNPSKISLFDANSGGNLAVNS